MPVKYAFAAARISASLPATWSLGGMTASFGKSQAMALPAMPVKSPAADDRRDSHGLVPRNGRPAACRDFSSLHKGCALRRLGVRPTIVRGSTAAAGWPSRSRWGEPMSQRHRPLLVASAIAALALALGIGDRSDAQVTAPATASAPQWRTPWGHPDLQGTWSSDDVRGIPLQRPEEFGTRAELTDEEFAERQRGNDAQVARLREGGTAFLAERGVRTFRQTSLVVDPPNGRIPPLTAAGQQRTDEQNARRRVAAELVGGPQPLRSLPHARRRRLDPARHLRQRPPDPSNAERRRDPLRDDPRDAHRAARRPPARRRRDQDVHGRRARPVRRRHARRRDDELHRPHRHRLERQRTAVDAVDARSSSASRAWPTTASTTR